MVARIEELTSSSPASPGLGSSSTSLTGQQLHQQQLRTTSLRRKRKPLPPSGWSQKALLRWVQQTATSMGFPNSLCVCFTHCSLMHHLRLGLEVKDFGPSWSTGLAFFAVIHSLRPNLVDMERVWGRPNRENLQEAFCVAETELGIPQLLDPEDVDVDTPDEKSIMTYVAQFLKHHPDRKQGDSDRQTEEEEVTSC
ncbi:nesprin-1-like protein [Lates japonicus]|uniref:Nesprin-1-like protein n=1 Tax=Lates japonicus TaxID=270547 RepID=A0AAD3NJQ5_LATJO|nr:nesprin-1-like protein [Lates japonicus]